MHNELDPLLLAQHGLVTRHQTWTAGVAPRQLDRLIANGLLVPVHRGVYRDPAAAITLEQRALGAVLASGTGAVASHRCGVAMWGARNYQCHLNEVITAGNRLNPGILAHRSARPPEQTVLRGVPVTSPARTMIDVATVVSRGVLGMWLPAWLSAKVVTLDELDQQMGLVKGHAGVPIVRAALTDRTILHAEADSAPEAALGLLLQAHGLPPLTLHHLVTLPTGVEFELDWSYPLWRIAFEMDGYGVHLRTPEAFEHDRFRRNELEIDGWTILNFTKRQVERKSKTVVGQVARLLEGRSLWPA